MKLRCGAGLVCLMKVFGYHGQGLLDTMLKNPPGEKLYLLINEKLRVISHCNHCLIGLTGHLNRKPERQAWGMLKWKVYF